MILIMSLPCDIRGAPLNFAPLKTRYHNRYSIINNRSRPIVIKNNESALSYHLFVIPKQTIHDIKRHTELF